MSLLNSLLSEAEFQFEENPLIHVQTFCLIMIQYEECLVSGNTEEMEGKGRNYDTGVGKKEGRM